LTVVLDEQREGDAVAESDSIRFVFKRADRLYVHKSTIDFDPLRPGAGLVVIPWFKGFL